MKTKQGTAMHSNRMYQQRKVAALFKRRGPNTFKKGAKGTGRRIAGHEPHANGTTNWVAFGALAKCRKVRRWRLTIGLGAGYFNEVLRKVAKRRAHIMPKYDTQQSCLFDFCVLQGKELWQRNCNDRSEGSWKRLVY